MELLEVQPIEIVQSYSNANSYILVLMEPKSRLNIPILIGEHEAQVLILAKENLKPIRPLTYNIVVDLCENYSLELSRIVVDKFSEGIFYSSLYFTDGITTKKIDSRTSDAITLALSMNATMYVTKSVLDETGVSADFLSDDDDTATCDECPTLEDLEAQLKILESKEEYEKAAELMQQINKMKEESL